MSAHSAFAPAPHTPADRSAPPPSTLFEEAPPSYGTSAEEPPTHAAPAQDANSGLAGDAPGYGADDVEAEPSLADLDNRELPKGWERCYDRSSGHCYFVHVLSDPVRSTWLHPLDVQPNQSAQTSGGASSSKGTSRTSIGRKLADIITMKKLADEQQAVADKTKLVKEQYEEFLALRRRATRSAPRYPAPSEAYPSGHVSGRYKDDGSARRVNNGPGQRRVAVMMGQGMGMSG